MIYIFYIPGTVLRWAVASESQLLAEKKVDGKTWKLHSVIPVDQLSITYTEANKLSVHPQSN